MGTTTKILFGSVATVFLATLFHGPLGFGKRLIDSLDAQAQAAVASVPGVVVRMDDSGLLWRGAILSGPATATQRALLLARIRAIPGMAAARWTEGGLDALAPVASIALPASDTMIAQCQDDIDTLTARRTIRFDVGAVALNEASAGVIGDIASALENCAGVRIEVAGHSDLSGNEPGNLKLSEQRAAVVMAALVARGAPPERLIAKGYGETRPVAKGSSAEAKAENRRIEFHVVSSDDAHPG